MALPTGRRLRALAALVVTVACTGCNPSRAPSSAPPRPAVGEFSVMSYNVRRYGLTDRDRDGQENDPKPDTEIAALLDVVASERPDVLAIQEMGPEPFFRDFRSRLEARGLGYPHGELLVAPIRGDANLAVLSRFPIVATDRITNVWYSIGTNRLPVLRGFLSVDIAPTDTYRFRLVNVHLKSRLYSSLGQTEMRRNEARLLNREIRKQLAVDPSLNLVVLGDFNDTIRSAALKEAKGDDLGDLPLADPHGDTWTHAWDAEDTYSRIDYMLVSAGMQPEVVMNKSRAVRHPRMLAASDHRPIIAVFENRDRPVTSAVR